MNTRKTAPVIGVVSLVALLTAGAGAAQARVMINDAPPARQAASQSLSFDRVEAIRSAKQAEAALTAKQGVSFDRAEAIRSTKQAEAGASVRLSPSEAQGARLQQYAAARAEAADAAAGDTVDDDLSPTSGGR
ncbi:MAG TPA: hypothetical protein VKA62_10990 [Agromyces sp.]|nr:hypothetical protein [Agromyces sp.]